ncbi:MAG: Chaperone SurA [bacterium]|nr:Chaperone SurA [bacterium]
MTKGYILLLAMLIPAAASPPVRGESAPGPDSVLATVQDNVVITVGDFDLYIRSQRQRIQNQAPNYPSYESLLRDFAMERVLAASEEAAEAEFLAMPSVRWGEWEIAANEAYTRVLEEIRASLSKPTEEELRAYFDEIRENLVERGSFSFRTLFYDALAVGDPGAREGLRKRAELARTLLLSKAAPDGTVPLEEFLRVAAMETEKPTSEFRVRGPFLLGKINPAIEKAVLATEPGKLTEIIETPQGFHIARTEERKLPHDPSFEEVRDKVAEAYRVREYERRKREYEQKNAMEEFMVIHEEGLDALLDKEKEGRSGALLAGAGSFDVTVQDYEDYCAAKARPPYPPDLEEENDIRDSIRTNLMNWLLIPDLLRQAAEGEGLTQSATHERRVAVDLEVLHGTEVFRRAARRRFERFEPIEQSRVEQYHAEHRRDFMNPTQYRLREIAVAPSPASNHPVEQERALRAAEERALAALAEIQAGSDEERVVRKYSVGEEASSGGVTDWLLDTTRYPKGMWEAVLARPRGEWIEKPIRFRNKAVLLKVLQEMPGKPKTFEEAESEVRGILENQRRDEMIRNLQEETLKKADFQIREEVLKQLPPIAKRFEKG